MQRRSGAPLMVPTSRCVHHALCTPRSLFRGRCRRRQALDHTTKLACHFSALLRAVVHADTQASQGRCACLILMASQHETFGTALADDQRSSATQQTLPDHVAKTVRSWPSLRTSSAFRRSTAPSWWTSCRQAAGKGGWHPCERRWGSCANTSRRTGRPGSWMACVSAKVRV